MSASASNPLFLPSLSTFLNSLPPLSRVSILLYNESISVILRREKILDGGRTAMSLLARSYKAKGKSDLNEAILGSLHLLSADDKCAIEDSYVVLITDGHPNIGATDTQAILTGVRNAGAMVSSKSVTFLMVGLGDRQPTGILEGLAMMEGESFRDGKWWCEKGNLASLPRTLAEIAMWVKYGVLELSLVNSERRSVRAGEEEYVLLEEEEDSGIWRNRLTGEEGVVETSELCMQQEHGEEGDKSVEENACARIQAVACILSLNHRQDSINNATALKSSLINVLNVLKKAKATEDRQLGRGLKGIAKRLEEERVKVFFREGNRREVEGRKSGGGEYGERKLSNKNKSHVAVAAVTQTEDGQRGAQEASFDKAKRMTTTLCGQSYTITKSIGAGAFGTIYKAVDESQNVRALKRIQNPFTSSYLSLQTEREIRILRHFRGTKGLVEIWGWGRDGDDVWVVMELVGTDLGRVIGSSVELGNKHKLKIAYRLMLGVMALHNAGVMHRDLKPGNILMDERCNVKIADFGMARGVEETLRGGVDGEEGSGGNKTEYVVTRYYRAPELLLGISTYTMAVDIWSVGCILGEICVRRPLFPGSNYVEQMNMVLGVVGRRIEDVSEFVNAGKAENFFKSADSESLGTSEERLRGMLEGRGEGMEEVVAQCLRVWEGGRKSAEEVIKMGYFDGIRREKDLRRVREGGAYRGVEKEEGAGERLNKLCGEGGGSAATNNEETIA